jgi:hypothetical protein
MTVDVEQVLGFAVQIGVLIGLIAGGVVWIKRWIRSTVSEPLKKQVEPNGGTNKDTTRSIIESIQQGQVELIDRLDHHDQIGERNHQLALTAAENSAKALAVAEHVSERMDKFLAKQGGTA